MTLKRILLFLLKNYAMLRRIVKFTFTGFLSWLVETLLLVALVELGGIFYFHAALVSIIISNSANFVINKIWTFGSKEIATIKRQIGLFLLGKVFALGLYMGLLYVLVNYAGFWYLYAQIITVLIVGVFNLIFSTLIVFKPVKL